MYRGRSLLACGSYKMASHTLVARSMVKRVTAGLFYYICMCLYTYNVRDVWGLWEKREFKEEIYKTGVMLWERKYGKRNSKNERIPRAYTTLIFIFLTTTKKICTLSWRLAIYHIWFYIHIYIHIHMWEYVQEKQDVDLTWWDTYGKSLYVY